MHTEIGKKVINKLLAADGKHGKPIYIDVRHMDVKARSQYYAMRDSILKADPKRKNIPIIMSHSAASGEDSTTAFLTGLCPSFDRYSEVKCPHWYYKKIIKYNRSMGNFPIYPINKHTGKKPKKNL